MVYQVASNKILISCYFWGTLWTIYMILDPKYFRIDGHMTAVYVLIRVICLEGNIDIKCWQAKHNIENVSRLSTNQNPAFLLEVWDHKMYLLKQFNKNKMFVAAILKKTYNQTFWGFFFIYKTNLQVSVQSTNIILNHRSKDKVAISW